MKAMFLCAAMLLVVSPVFAGGIDLTINACPGIAGAVGGDAGLVDCVGGSPTIVLCTFAPNEAISDLAGLEAVLQLQVATDLDVTNFWNMSPTGCGANVLVASHTRPVTGCSNHLSTWSVVGSGEGAGVSRISTAGVRIAVTVFRPTPVSVAANQRLFGFQLIFDTTQSVESGGTCNGCPDPVCLVWNVGTPRRACGAGSALTTGTGFAAGVDNTLRFNGSSLCSAVSARSQTIDQIRSLYR